MRIAAGIEYCGAAFHGWQSQTRTRNIQDCVVKALSSVANHPVQVHCAGRTDAGVHALEQVVHFDTDSQRGSHAWVLGANVNLPGDVRILWASEVKSEFHARFSATGRQYQYIILNRTAAPAVYRNLVSWECRHLDVDRMRIAAGDLIGKHDFTSYRAVACRAPSPVREIRDLCVERRGNMIIIRVTANAFLHHMVRNIAGVLMTIGMGREEPGWAKQVLDARDRTAGGVTAAPDGLYLVKVEYPSVFELPDREADYWPLWES